MGCKSFDVVRFDLGPLLQGHTRIAKFKTAYISLIIGPKVSNVKPTYSKSWASKSSDEVRFVTFGHMRIAKFKTVYYSLIIGPRGLQCETNL